MKGNAIITGASRGIGLAIADKLAKDGFFIHLLDLDKEAGINSAEKIGSERAKFHACDISKEENVEKFFKEFKASGLSMDVLVNNAGIIRDNMIWNMSADDFDKVISVNLKGAWLMCREAAILMREQKSGRIVNIASRAWLGNRGQSNYASSKGGLISLTRVLALELGKYNILVNAVAPGLIDTPLTQSLPEKVLNNLIQAQPTRTMGSPSDVARAVSFLVNEETGFITGQTLYVDGGKSIGAGI